MRKINPKKIRILTAILITFVFMMSAVGVITQENATIRISGPRNLNDFISHYGLREVKQYSSLTHIQGNAYPLDGINMSNSVLNISFVWYNSSKSGVHAFVEETTINGNIFHQSLVLNSTSGNSSETSIIPIYSHSGNYNIRKIPNNVTTNTISPDVCVTIQAYTLTDGIGLGQQATKTLVYALGVGAVITGAALLAAGASAILAIGAGTIAWYDSMGGNNGVAITWGWDWIFPWVDINAPFDPSGSYVIGTQTLRLNIP